MVYFLHKSKQTIMDEQNFQEASEAQSATVQSSKNSLMIPVAIVLGFGLIAAAIFFSGAGGGGKTITVSGAIDNANQPQAAVTGPVRPVDENDHIRGNPNAPVMIVEYSDYDCPFCKNFHETMNQIMDNYGTTGDVAWVYRHFPIESLHPSAAYIAAASECVANIGGNDAFWTFSDLIFSERNTNEGTDVTRLTEFAETSGVNGAAFDACLESGETRGDVEADFADAINAGAKGTPHSIISVAGQEGVINGAQPYEVVSKIIENLLTQIEGGNIEQEAPAS